LTAAAGAFSILSAARGGAPERDREASGVGEREIFGRERELGELLGCLDAVADGPAACVLAGEAGIGKSALWERAVAEATGRSLCVLSSRPAEKESMLSYAALDDLLEPVLASSLPLLAEPKRRALEVALLRTDLEGADVDQRAVSRAVLDVVRLASEAAPLLLAVDTSSGSIRPRRERSSSSSDGLGRTRSVSSPRCAATRGRRPSAWTGRSRRAE
jgi:hypothetical protein